MFSISTTASRLSRTYWPGKKKPRRGVGKGIGIPHAKTAGASEPTVAFTRSSEGVDFGAPDGEPATLLFMILVPEAGSGEHLEILSSLSRALMHDEVREDLHAAGSPKEVTTVLTNAIT